MLKLACVVAGEAHATKQTHPHQTKTRVTIDFSKNFHNGKIYDRQTSDPLYKSNRSRNRNPASTAGTAQPGRCTNFGHPLVERLHSIACKRDKSSHFLLTIKMKGVKTTSFFHPS